MNIPRTLHSPLVRTATGLVLAVAASTACATEGGTSAYPQGSDNFMAGALPPPGLYGMVFTQHYSADRVKGAGGQNLNVPGFKVTANAVVPRLVWVTGAKVLGGDLVAHAIAPLVDLKVSVAGTTQSKSGLGDVTTGLGLGYHHSPALHSVVGLDVVLPTGGYTSTDQANIGRNVTAVEPLYALSYIDPQGFNADLHAGLTFYQRNSATDYTSGHEFHADYSAGWAVGNGWTVGVGGYVLQQLGDDKKAGATLADSKGKAFAIGPSVKYDSGKGWFVTLKYQKETSVENRAQGSAFWVKAVFPL